MLVADDYSSVNFNRYLSTGNPQTLPSQRFHSDENGEYYAYRITAGNGKHDVRMLVIAGGYQDHIQRVWKGRGGPGDDCREVDVALVPIP